MEISSIIITGGTTELNDFNLVVEEMFAFNVPVYKVREMGCRHNKYSSVLGMIKYYHDKLAFRNKIASTMDEESQVELVNNRKSSNSSVLGKIYGYFFNN